MVRSASRSRFLFEHDPSGHARGHAFRKTGFHFSGSCSGKPIGDNAKRYRITLNIGNDRSDNGRKGGIPIAQPAPVIATLRTAAPQKRPMPPHGLWRGRSLRAQLLMIFVLIDAAALLVGGSVAVLRARAQTRVEMAASMRLAEALVGDAAALAHQQLPAEQFLANLPVQLRSIRHVRVAVKNETGIPIRPIPPTDSAARA